MATAEELINGAQDRMAKSVEHARSGFATVRTGRASATLLDRIEVDYYGTPTHGPYAPSRTPIARARPT